MELVFYGLMRSGNHAVIKWLAKGLVGGGEYESYFDTRIYVNNESNASHCDGTEGSLVYFNDVGRPLVMDEVKPMISKFSEFKYKLVSVEDEYIPWNKTVVCDILENPRRVFIFRNLEDCATSRKKLFGEDSEEFQETKSRYDKLWDLEKDSQDVIIDYDRWVESLLYRSEILEKFNIKPTDDNLCLPPKIVKGPGVSSFNCFHLSLVLMVKNEEERILVTLNSVLGFVESLVVYDTGSTDKTLEIITNFSENHNIPLRLLQGEFVNFSVSRNRVLDFADTYDDIDYLLLFDANDELRGGKYLRDFISGNPQGEVFMVNQHLDAGTEQVRFRNIRLLKSRCGWRYNGSVHEYLAPLEGKAQYPLPRVPEEVVIYQDRFKDSYKSMKRFEKDKELLLIEYEADTQNSRAVFYLAQSYGSLGDKANALNYYKIRAEMIGFYEETWISMLKCGKLSLELKMDFHNDVLPWLTKALETPTGNSGFRAEPALILSDWYRAKQNWLLSYHYAKMACEMSYPDILLFYNHNLYDYYRWHLLGIVSYYVKQTEVGRNACEIAIREANKDIDKKNLKFYL